MNMTEYADLTGPYGHVTEDISVVWTVIQYFFTC